MQRIREQGARQPKLEIRFSAGKIVLFVDGVSVLCPGWVAGDRSLVLEFYFSFSRGIRTAPRVPPTLGNPRHKVVS